MFWLLVIPALLFLHWIVGKMVSDPTQNFKPVLDSDEDSYDMEMPDASTRITVPVRELGPLLARLEEELPGLSVAESAKVLERASMMRVGRTSVIPVQLGEGQAQPEEIQIRLGKPRAGEILLFFLGVEETIEKIESVLPHAESDPALIEPDLSEEAFVEEVERQEAVLAKNESLPSEKPSVPDSVLFGFTREDIDWLHPKIEKALQLSLPHVGVSEFGEVYQLPPATGIECILYRNQTPDDGLREPSAPDCVSFLRITAGDTLGEKLIRRVRQTFPPQEMREITSA